jgi:hypothetical protein
MMFAKIRDLLGIVRKEYIHPDVGYVSPAPKLGEKNYLNDYIYIYYICNGHLVYDRTVGRSKWGVRRAKERVEQYEKRGIEAFYTIGDGTRIEAAS